MYPTNQPTDGTFAFYSRGDPRSNKREKSTSYPPPNETKRTGFVLPSFRVTVDAFSVPFSRASFRNVLFFFFPTLSKFEGRRRRAQGKRKKKQIYAGAVFKKQRERYRRQKRGVARCKVVLFLLATMRRARMRMRAFYVQ